MKKQILLFLNEIFKIVAISLPIILFVHFFLIQPFIVKGVSMESNFLDNDYLMVDKLSYRFSNPQRGDVIIFKYPLDPSQYYIKRIIGLPNETIEIKERKVVIYNNEFKLGAALDEFYLDKNQVTLGDLKIKLDENDYFVMGDNRSLSSDSRRWGPVMNKFIVGRAWLRLWPLNKMKMFKY